MFIAGVLCFLAALAVAARGVWTLTRPQTTDLVQQVLRAVAPTQLAAAAMLTAAGVAAFVAPRGTALVALIVCVIGAVGTVAAGVLQSARFAARQEELAAARSGGCGGGCCSGCDQPCS